MGKFAKAKKAGQISDKSRAARRAASPSIDLDKSITSLKAPVDAVDYNPKILGASPAGIKKKNNKRMTRAQRMRQEKGMDRAENNSEMLHQKRVKSIAKEKRTKDRAGEWEELNRKFASADPSKSNNKFNAIADEWEDEEDMSDDDGPAELKKANKQTISAQNMSRFDISSVEAAAPQDSAAPAPDATKAIEEEIEIDEVL